MSDSYIPQEEHKSSASSSGLLFEPSKFSSDPKKTSANPNPSLFSDFLSIPLVTNNVNSQLTSELPLNSNFALPSSRLSQNDMFQLKKNNLNLLQNNLSNAPISKIDPSFAPLSSTTSFLDKSIRSSSNIFAQSNSLAFSNSNHRAIFTSQPSSPKLNSVHPSSTNLEVSAHPTPFLNSVSSTRRNSPENDQIWNTLETLSINDTSNSNTAFNKTRLNNRDQALFSNKFPYANNDSYNYSDNLRGDAYLSLNNFAKQGANASFSHISKFHPGTDNTDGSNTEFDAQLPSGLLDDDDFLTINKNSHFSSFDSSKPRHDASKLGPSKEISLHDSKLAETTPFDLNYSEFNVYQNQNQSQHLSPATKPSAFGNTQSSTDQTIGSDINLNLLSKNAFDLRANSRPSPSLYNQIPEVYHSELQYQRPVDNFNYPTFDVGIPQNNLLGVHNASSGLSNTRFDSSAYIDAIATDNNQNSGNLIVDNTLNSLNPTSSLVRNLSMPVLNAPQNSILQQHYQELTKLLTVSKETHNNEYQYQGPNSANPSLVQHNAKNSSSSSNVNSADAMKKQKKQAKFKPKLMVENTELGTPNMSEQHSNKNQPDIIKSHSAVNLQNHVNNRNSRKYDIDHNKYSNVKLESLAGKLYNVCKDQYGCRYLQKQLEEGTTKQTEMIYNEITPHFSKLMVDPFGNYLCQKLFEHCNEHQRTHIINLISKDLVNISLNIHGTRASQKLIDLLTTQEQINYIIQALDSSVVLLIRDLNGNHVIQKCLNKLINTPYDEKNKNYQNVQFIYDSVARNCIQVATHRHGCCVFQRCIDVASPKQLKQLVLTVSENALVLVQDPFGNYVVQYVLDLNSDEINEMLINRFVPNYAELSKQKFSSNVMEKCFKLSSQNLQSMIVYSILQNQNQHHLSTLIDLISDSYGNYVIQTILDNLKDSKTKLQLVESIKLIQNNVKLTPYGKRIINKMYRDGLVTTINSACHSTSNSRIPSPVLSTQHPHILQNKSQFQQSNIHVAFSTPNLLASNQNQYANNSFQFNALNGLNAPNNLVNLNQQSSGSLSIKNPQILNYNLGQTSHILEFKRECKLEYKLELIFSFHSYV
ncbi:hypothetical protein BB560_003387 [Smittium megazygosporum]|uniref:PUM-HD domain-containing protein n=1 Tax=Smittium megazygosporum TaxID=133381 RepID=A0A2T9ZC47_9FUNG|nr:hypothetical protein BB560_003387 [Smittium megazygosporum]